MSCPVREEDIALYLTGDLECQNIAALRRHLDRCSECQGRLADFIGTAELVRSAFAPPIEDDLRRVREGVSSAVAQRKKTGRGMAVWTIAASLAAAAALLFWQSRPPRQPDAGRVQKTALITPAVRAPWAFPNLDASPKKRRRAHPVLVEAGLRSVSLTINSSGNPELRLMTADPNVVILLPMGDTTHAN